jgi:hypothetical protein
VASSWSDARMGSSFDVIEDDPHPGFQPQATGKNLGHLHSLNRHGPLSEWMNSECRHQEQGLARLASRSIQRTADRLALVMGTHRRLCALQRHRLDGAASISAERPIPLGRSSPMTGYAIGIYALPSAGTDRGSASRRG